MKKRATSSGLEAPRGKLDRAIEAGDLARVQSILSAEGLPKGWTGSPPLLRAARLGRDDIARALLEAGADVELGDEAPLLFSVAREGQAEAARVLLDLGAAVDAGDEDGRTPLMAAAFEGHLATVEILLARGATVDRWAQGEHALENAAQNGHTQIYELLRLRSANPIALNRAAEAVVLGRARAERRLKKALSGEMLLAAGRGDLEEIRRCLARGEAVDAATIDTGKTALHIAVANRQVEAVRLLLGAGADPNARSDQDGGTTPLHLAAYGRIDDSGRRVEILRVLASAGAKLEAKDGSGRTALILAAMTRAGSVVELLVELGARVDAVDGDGNDALVLLFGARRAFPSAIARLLQAGAAREGQATALLFEAVQAGDPHLAEFLVVHGAKVDHSINGSTPLMSACPEDHGECARVLLRRGADPNRRVRGQTPLIWAASHGALDIVRALIEARAEINAEVESRGTALDHARMRRLQSGDRERPFGEIVQALISVGARSTNTDVARVYEKAYPS